jgi:acyl carrier protein
MSKRHLIESAFFDSFDELNEMLPAEKHLSKDSSTIVAGESSHLDSLMLLNLMISVEEKLKNRISLEFSFVEFITNSKESEISVEMLAEYVVNNGDQRA